MIGLKVPKSKLFSSCTAGVLTSIRYKTDHKKDKIFLWRQYSSAFKALFINFGYKKRALLTLVFSM